MFARLLRSAILSVEILAALAVLSVACASAPGAGPYRGEVMEVRQWTAQGGPNTGHIFYDVTIGVELFEGSYEQFSITIPWGTREAVLFAVPGRCVMVSPGSMAQALRLSPCRD